MAKIYFHHNVLSSQAYNSLNVIDDGLNKIRCDRWFHECNEVVISRGVINEMAPITVD